MAPENGKVSAANLRLCSEWLDWLRAHGRSPISVYQYGAKCEELITFLGPTPLERVTLPQLETWVARPRKGRGRGQLGADSTRSKDVIVLRGLFKWACAHGHLIHNPALDLEAPKVRNENPRAIPVETWERVWTSPVMTHDERVAFGLGFYCGLRREEICRLEVAHVNLGKGAIVGFKRKGDRNGHKTGSTPVVSCARLFAQKHPRLLDRPEDFLGPLSDLWETRSGAKWLLPWGEEALASPHRHRRSERPGPPEGMTSPDQINGRLLRFLERAGMDGRTFSPHALRHSFVTYMLKADVPLEVVSRLANHSSLDITLRYVHLAEDPLAELVDPRPLRGSRW